MIYKKLIIGMVFLLVIFNATAQFNFYGFEDGQVEEYNDFVILHINGKNISITPLEQKELSIYNGKPSQEILDSDKKLVYIIEHYSPDKKLNDDTRLDGEKKLTAVVKEAKVEIDNGIVVRTDGLKISTKSILQSESFNDREINFLSTKLTEIFGSLKELFFRISDFKLSDEYDRGFYTGFVSEYVPEFSDEDFIDVVPNTDCSKFGFVFYPDNNYNYLDQTLEFTKDKGYVLGIADTKVNDYQTVLNNMILFIEKAHENNLTPIVRILEINWQNGVSNSNDVVDFIKELKQKTGDKLEYVQIWDKPNLAYGENNFFTIPENYASYVIEIKNKLNDDSIKIIPASLSIGTDDSVLMRNNSQEYLVALLKIPEFWESIDYWASSAYNKKITQENYCKFDDETSLIEGENMCLSSIYAYEKELNMIYQETEKQYEVFLTDVGYPLTEDVDKFNFLFKFIKEDPKVKGSLIFLANGWSFYDNTNWLDITTGKIISLNNELSICE